MLGVLDSDVYWTLANTFLSHGSFSFSAFHNPDFGYSLPLIDLGLRKAAALLGLTPLTVLRVFNSMLFSVLVAVLLPLFAQRTWMHATFGTARRLALALLVLILWAGFLNYNLTDFPGVFALLLAIIVVTGEQRHFLLRCGLSGALAAVAVNLRPPYLLCPFLLLLLTGLTAKRGAKTKISTARTLCVTAALVGIVLASLPESWSNHEYYGTWDPIAGAPARITTVQLSDGLSDQRYDTNIGQQGYPAQLVYTDSATLPLLDALPHQYVSGYAQYATIILQHPLTMAGGLFRRFINGMDQHYDSAYVTAVRREPDFLDALSGALLITAVARLLIAAQRLLRVDLRQWVALAAFLSPCLAALPSAMETRFMLPASLTCCLIVLLPGWRTDLAQFVARRGHAGPVLALTAMLISYCAWFAIIGNTLASLTPR